MTGADGGYVGQGWLSWGGIDNGKGGGLSFGYNQQMHALVGALGNDPALQAWWETASEHRGVELYVRAGRAPHRTAVGDVLLKEHGDHIEAVVHSEGRKSEKSDAELARYDLGQALTALIKELPGTTPPQRIEELLRG